VEGASEMDQATRSAPSLAGLKRSRCGRRAAVRHRGAGHRQRPAPRAWQEAPLHLDAAQFVAGQKPVIANILKAMEDDLWTPRSVRPHAQGRFRQHRRTDLQHWRKRSRPQSGEPSAAGDRCPLGDLQKPLDHLIAQLEQKLPEEQGKTTVPVDRRNSRRSVTA